MKASYISYFEGYDINGRVIFAGNGSCTVEYDEAGGIDPDGLLNNHCAHLLKVAQAKNTSVARVHIKNMMRL
ncbi:hypothetical protein ACEZEZ_09425 [Kluyvera ascorbata]|uniref:hypothetical protein n=1 Tax=Kluyvera ascorbata TaxID=51288 RepID=UPI002B3FBE33|nr:hypothetical protein [Escherichia coli]